MNKKDNLQQYGWPNHQWTLLLQRSETFLNGWSSVVGGRMSTLEWDHTSVCWIKHHISTIATNKATRRPMFPPATRAKMKDLMMDPWNTRDSQHCSNKTNQKNHTYIYNNCIIHTQRDSSEDPGRINLWLTGASAAGPTKKTGKLSPEWKGCAVRALL